LGREGGIFHNVFGDRPTKWLIAKETSIHPPHPLKNQNSKEKPSLIFVIVHYLNKVIDSCPPCKVHTIRCIKKTLKLMAIIKASN
jgi:hypothetical protein